MQKFLKLEIFSEIKFWWIFVISDSETMMRRNSAMRSFTESVDSDLPPAPELPPSLNIDLQYPEETMKKSETSETIIEASFDPFRAFDTLSCCCMVDDTLSKFQNFLRIISHYNCSIVKL